MKNKPLDPELYEALGNLVRAVAGSNEAFALLDEEQLIELLDSVQMRQNPRSFWHPLALED